MLNWYGTILLLMEGMGRGSWTGAHWDWSTSHFLNLPLEPYQPNISPLPLTNFCLGSLLSNILLLRLIDITFSQFTPWTPTTPISHPSPWQFFARDLFKVIFCFWDWSTSHFLNLPLEPNISPLPLTNFCSRFFWLFFLNHIFSIYPFNPTNPISHPFPLTNFCLGYF